MIDASRKDLAAVSICPHRLCSTLSTAISQTYNQIVLLQPYANPIITLAPDIEESCAVSDVSDLLVLVQVFVEERLDLLLVDIAHLLWRYCDHIPVLVASLRCQLVDILFVGEIVIENAELREVVCSYFLAGVVSLALVDLQSVSANA